MKRLLPGIVSIVLISLWFGATIAVDFLAIPSVFKNVSNLEEAGRVGMRVFGLFNRLEFTLALVLLALGLWAFSRRTELLPKWLMRLHFSALAIVTTLATSYLFFLTPTLTALTVEKNNAFEEEVRVALEAKLHIYHNLYVQLDSLKLLLLLTLIFTASAIIKKLARKEVL